MDTMNLSLFQKKYWNVNMDRSIHEQRLKLLLTSYSLKDILEEHDIETHFVLELLVDQGHVDLERYFDDTCAMAELS